jgi:iron-sulfur cluster assembly accessory protein
LLLLQFVGAVTIAVAGNWYIFTWFFKEMPMATTTTPEVTTQPHPETAPKALPVNLTPNAIAKVKEIMAGQTPAPSGLRVGVVGGGCSGFSYSMQFENAPGMMDKVFEFDGLKVYVDATSVMYLNGCRVDYVETLEGAGFKFDNPNVKSTCGCGSSFSV